MYFIIKGNATACFKKQATKKMGKLDIGSIGTGAANQVTGGLIGQIFAGANDRRQIRQQQKLQDIAIKGNKELADYQQGLSMDMWNKTNYEAQVQHLKNAGLNPALLYGQSGGGGTTANTGGGMAIGGGGQAANSAQTEANQINSGLAIAQTQALEAQANKANAEAKKIGGADTEVANMQVQKMISEINNNDERTKATKIANEIEQVKAKIMSNPANFNDIEVGLMADYWKMRDEAKITFNNAQISEKSQQTMIKIINQEYQNMIVDKKLKESGISLNSEQEEMIKSTINYQTNLIEQQKLDREQGAENVKKIANAMMIGAGIQAVGNITETIINWRGKIATEAKKQAGENKRAVMRDYDREIERQHEMMRDYKNHLYRERENIHKYK